MGLADLYNLFTNVSHSARRTGEEIPVAENRNVFWIASYPKSGNTWVRFIVCNILKGRAVENSAEIEALTPDMHKRQPETLPFDCDRLFLKTHWACTPAMPLYDRTVGAIYVVRHPGDVLASNLAYLAVPKQHESPVVDQFIRLGGLEHWTRFGMGTWFENVRSWTSGQHPFPVHVITYESLLSAPTETIGRIADHIGHPVTADDAARIADETRFPRMRSLDLREKNRVSDSSSFFVSDATGTTRGRRVFMRSGKTRQYRSLLNPRQKERFGERFGSIVRQLELQP